ncbi:MAG: sensor histidine kinase [Chloroflexi bacterium]|nr:sensor histidine kinase [Chloroflexota bacterium]
MKSQTPLPQQLKATLKDIQWRWIFGATFAVLALIQLIMFLIISIYVARNSAAGNTLNFEEISQFSETLGKWVGPWVLGALVFSASLWMAIKVRVAPRAHGWVFGLLIVIISLVSDAIFSPTLTLSEILSMLLVIPVAGFAAYRGEIILKSREAVYRTSQALGGQDKAGMLVAVGEQLASPSVAWIALADDDGALDSASAWVSSSRQHIPTSIPPIHSQPKLATHIKTDSLPQPIPAIRFLLILPLSNVEAFLVIASRNKSGFSRIETQNYQTIAEQVSLSLENLLLVDQAREAGIIEERQRLAAEIHDGLTQGFVSIVTHLEVAEAKMEQQPPEVRTDFQGLLNQMRQTARENLTAAREMTWALRPDLQKGFPLPEALNKLINDWAAGDDDTSVSFSYSGNMRQLHPDIETAIFRTLREALANIKKHASATQVIATLTYLDTIVALDVQDNGKGFDPEAHLPKDADGGFGLKSLQEQAERLGGEMSVESEIGKGCTIAISIPESIGEKA